VTRGGITDLSPNNILLSLDHRNKGVFEKIEQQELEAPSARKVLSDRCIYFTHEVPLTHGAPVITDFGAARLGDPGQQHSGDAMPTTYRAPEIILAGRWDSKIDTWSLGVMVSLECCRLCQELG
jgi:serine/threonine protein kinase